MLEWWEVVTAVTLVVCAIIIPKWTISIQKSGSEDWERYAYVFIATMGWWMLLLEEGVRSAMTSLGLHFQQVETGALTTKSIGHAVITVGAFMYSCYVSLKTDRNTIDLVTLFGEIMKRKNGNTESNKEIEVEANGQQ
jgi:hypothetical protein